jgi:hypothetical protein
MHAVCAELELERGLVLLPDAPHPGAFGGGPIQQAISPGPGSPWRVSVGAPDLLGRPQVQVRFWYLRSEVQFSPHRNVFRFEGDDAKEMLWYQFTLNTPAEEGGKIVAAVDRDELKAKMTEAIDWILERLKEMGYEAEWLPPAA